MYGGSEEKHENPEGEQTVYKPRFEPVVFLLVN